MARGRKRKSLTPVEEPAQTSTSTAKAVSIKTDAKIPKTKGGNSKSLKKLPKIILAYYDKDGRAQSKEYVCQEVNIVENTQTTLEGANPTGRRDTMDISIEAKVLEAL